MNESSRHGKHASPRFHLTVPEPLYSQIQEQARLEGRTVSELFRTLAEEYLKQRRDPAPP